MPRAALHTPGILLESARQLADMPHACHAHPGFCLAHSPQALHCASGSASAPDNRHRSRWCWRSAVCICYVPPPLLRLSRPPPS
ncbi:unnamed protein product [Arctia plantaginis]|uniref:Uncharacterized protein n=1 Tax=Arctia plantaginis TaxID=874455 RepID=A0A8S1BT85_ARCPL|nr:unnamed protein product [Arctia plantaginis]